MLRPIHYRINHEPDLFTFIIHIQTDQPHRRRLLTLHTYFAIATSSSREPKINFLGHKKSHWNIPTLKCIVSILCWMMKGKWWRWWWHSFNLTNTWGLRITWSHKVTFLNFYLNQFRTKFADRIAEELFRYRIAVLKSSNGCFDFERQVKKWLHYTTYRTA